MHINRWTPGGGMSVTTDTLTWDGQGPLTAKDVITAIFKNEKPGLISQPPGHSTARRGDVNTESTDEWVFIHTPTTGNPEFINVWIEDILPAYQKDLELREASRRVTQLADSVRTAELELNSKKYQHEQAVNRLKELQEKPTT